MANAALENRWSGVSNVLPMNITLMSKPATHEEWGSATLFGCIAGRSRSEKCVN